MIISILLLTISSFSFHGCNSNTRGGTTQAPGGRTTPAPEGIKLRFSEEGKFRVLQFSDIHYGEGSVDTQGDRNDEKSKVFQERMLTSLKPDLLDPIDTYLLYDSVVLNGDMFSNYGAPGLCASLLNCTDWFVEQWEKFTMPMRAAGIPYAYVLGNHDWMARPFPPKARDVIRYDIKYGNTSLTREAPEGLSGASVYYLPIYSDRDKRPTAVLWMMDSGMDNCTSFTGWGCIEADQVQWFEKTASTDDLAGVQGIMFAHIPFVEVSTLSNLYGARGISGAKGEPIACSSANTGIFTSAIRHNVTGISHGHNHNNDFMVDAKFIDGKIRIGYGRKSGYGGYSGAIAEHPGVRVFDLSLSEDHTTFVWETSMSYENGTEITQEMDDILVDPGNFQASEYCSGMRKSFVETLEL